MAASQVVPTVGRSSVVAESDYELHNIWELDAETGYPGPLVRRLPRSVAEQLANGARVAEDAALSEVRFVKERGHRLAVCLTSLEGSDLFVYRGDFLFTHVRLPAGALYRLVLDDESLPLKLWRPEALAPRRFSPAVWRVCLDGPTLFHGVDRMGCVLRRPLPEEKPARRWLAYGSSITQGFSPVTRQQCYVAQTARRLGVDVVNLGLSGSCHVEPVMAEHIAARDDWDFATLELGINVRFLLTPQEFEARAREFLRILTAARPGKPVVLFTLFPNIGDYLIEPDEGARRGRAFNAILRQIAADFAGRSVHLIEGADILTDLSGLTCDLVHPGTEGHTEMAQNLAERLRSIIE